MENHANDMVRNISQNMEINSKSDIKNNTGSKANIFYMSGKILKMDIQTKSTVKI